MASRVAAMAMALVGMLGIGMAMGQGEGFKVERFALYLHDKITSPNTTGVRVAGPNGDTTTTQFGSLFVIDNIITAEQSNTSTQIGRAKGTFMVASVDESYAFLHFSAVLNTSAYNGTLAFQGTDASLGPSSSKELAIVGGTGDFRLALGFANYTTVELDIPDSTALLNCTVFLPILDSLVASF